VKDNYNNHAWESADRADTDSQPVDRNIRLTYKAHDIKEIDQEKDNDSHDCIDHECDKLLEKEVQDYRDDDGEDDSGKSRYHGIPH
jgi:hypothetical protein